MNSAIYAKLAIVQQTLKVPKSQYNSFGHYRYRTTENILSALKPILQTTGLILTLSDELVHSGDRYYVKSTARLVDIDSGDSIEAYAWAREDDSRRGMADSQITGASTSYARKYAVSGLCALDDARDADVTNTSTCESTAPSSTNTKKGEDLTNKNEADAEAQAKLWEAMGFPVHKK